MILDLIQLGLIFGIVLPCTAVILRIRAAQQRSA